MISKRRDCRQGKCHRTATSHKSGNKMKRKEVQVAGYYPPHKPQALQSAGRLQCIQCRQADSEIREQDNY